MAKKIKKQVRKSNGSLNPVLVSVETPRASERDFNPDYSPVIKDLKRIGILAGTFFMVLIGLSFFLR
jgi:hypothetical protein